MQRDLAQRLSLRSRSKPAFEHLFGAMLTRGRPQGPHGPAGFMTSTTPTRGFAPRNRLGGNRARNRQGADRDAPQGRQYKKWSRPCRQRRATISAINFARIQMLRRNDQIDPAAADLMLIDPHPISTPVHDADQWWIERRHSGAQAARSRRSQDGLSGGAPVRPSRGATTTASTSSSPPAGSRFAISTIRRPPTTHFTHVADGNEQSDRRWRGPAIGRVAPPRRSSGRDEAHAHYQEAARYPTAYYGQLARAKARAWRTRRCRACGDAEPSSPRRRGSTSCAPSELLYAIDARDLADIAAGRPRRQVGTTPRRSLRSVRNRAKYQDARGMMLLGKLALGAAYR